MENKIEYCQNEIEKMLSRSKTKIIFPIISYGLIKQYYENKQEYFSDREIKNCYENSVNFFKEYLGHSLHIGGRYYDAYPSRNLPKYGVLKVIDNKKYFLNEPFQNHSIALLKIIPQLVKEHITNKIGKIPLLERIENRVDLAKNKEIFIE